MSRVSEHGAWLDGGTQVASTLKCPHCGLHFDPQQPLATNPRELVVRGFCEYCFAVTCGSESCYPCIPEELMLHRLEQQINAKAEFWLRMDKLR